MDGPPPTQLALAMLRVPGTRLSIAAPRGFRLATNFTGIEKDAFTAIAIMDFPEGNFYTNTANYTKEGLEEKGLQVLTCDHVEVAGYQGIQTLIKSPVDGSLSCQLVFGDTTFSALVAGTLLEADTTSLKSIQWALGTVTYDKNVTVGPYEGTSFRLNDHSTDFKFASKGGGVWLYSRGGVVKTDYADDPFLMALPLPFESPMNCRGLAEKMITSIEEKGFVKARVENESSDRVNGFDSYEAEYYGKIQGEQTLIYLLVVALGERAVVLEGKSIEPYQPTLKAFKELAHSISFQ